MKRSKMKKVMSLVLAGAMTLCLTACGSKGEENTSPAASAENSTVQSQEESAGAPGEVSYEGKEITVWISSGAEDDIYREMFDSIEAELGVTIVDEYYAQDEVDSKMKTSQIAGDMPDAVIIDYLFIPNYYEAGLIAELDDYISTEITDDFLPSVLSECTYNDSIISVAQFESGLAFWANKEMLENAGVRIPESYTDAWDKEEFEDALAKLKESGVEYPLYVRQNKPSTEYYTWMPFVASFGGDYMNRETGLCTGTLDSEETIQAFEYLSWLFEMGYCDPNCDYDDSFPKGENALALYGHSKYQDYSAGVGEDNLILVPLPDMGNGVYTCSGSTVMVMTTGAQEKGVDDAAWAVLEKAVSPEYITMVVEVNGAIPARLSAMDAIEEYQEGGKLYLYREQLEAGISFMRPYTCAHMTIYDAVTTVISDIYAGADAEEELHSAAEYVDEIIMENGWNN